MVSDRAPPGTSSCKRGCEILALSTKLQAFDRSSWNSVSQATVSKISPHIQYKMAAILQERKRKRSAPKSALSTKKARRAAAYHSSSSEDEAEPLKTIDAPRKVEQIINGIQPSGEENDSHVELPNLALDAPIGKVVAIDKKALAEEEGAEWDDASLGSDIGDEDDEDGDMSEDSDDDVPQDSDETDSVADPSKPLRKKSKRHNPEIFANSIQRILSSKLTSSKRADPMLSRSTAAQEAAKTLTEQKLDKAARKKLRADKIAEKEKGHEPDVLGSGRPDVSTGEVVEMEKMLKRTAQKGVIKLFNAVRAAQMGGLQAEKEAQGEDGRVIGLDSRKRKVDEMSKQGFLDLLASGKATGT